MAKAALHMMTKCLCKLKLKTDDGKRFRFHGCDPGWVSVDEYYENGAGFKTPPLDEVDEAARILYPVWKKLGSTKKTRRHFFHLKY